MFWHVDILGANVNVSKWFSILPQVGYSVKGTDTKVHSTNSNFEYDHKNDWTIESRSNTFIANLCFELFFDISKFELNFQCGPGTEYLLRRTINDLGVSTDVTVLYSQWGMNIVGGPGISYKIKNWTVGLQNYNEIGLIKRNVEFGTKSKGIKYSVLLTLEYSFKR